MKLGTGFARWGLGLFLFGIFLTFGIVAHYCVGARWPTGELFMQNIALWWACPWTLSVAAVQAGGLGMVAMGLTGILASRMAPTIESDNENPVPLWLCVCGLFGVFAVGYPGYFVFDAVWPGYYYSPIILGKNAWLLGQALFIAIYFAGAVMMCSIVWRTLDNVPKEQANSSEIVIRKSKPAL